MTTAQDAKPDGAGDAPIIITGYQYGDYGHFIGEYRFEKNRDKPAIHMPPRTTLEPPPNDHDMDQEPFFNGKAWEIRKLALPWLPDRELPTERDGDASAEVGESRDAD